MKLHNTLTRKTEEFIPIKEGFVSLYTCGPTVYDHVQIGNFRTFIFEDMLRRTLALNGYSVNHVMNITDVDDKTIKRSAQEYPDEDSMVALKKLTGHYEKKFYEDATKVGIDLSASKIVKATDHIVDMQELINRIPNKYVADDGVYYDINKDPDYGVLVTLDRGHEHHRIDNDEYDKDHVADFALWKAQMSGEPSWPYKIDGKDLTGRPGWHVECSAMSVKYLGQPFDIHTGGIDLMFPHHENEIAQNRAAADGQPLANFFIHGEHLLVDGKKMSKSLKNFFVISDLAEHSVDPLAFRLLVLQAHYRSQMNFTWESLEAAQANLRNLGAWADQVHQSNSQKLSRQIIDRLKKNVEGSLSDDLNSAGALAALNTVADEGAPTPELLDYLDRVFGLALANRPDIKEDQKALINERERARKAKDWAKSDELRQKLENIGLDINDTPGGPIWRRAK